MKAVGFEQSSARRQLSLLAELAISVHAAFCRDVFCFVGAGTVSTSAISGDAVLGEVEELTVSSLFSWSTQLLFVGVRTAAIV